MSCLGTLSSFAICPIVFRTTRRLAITAYELTPSAYDWVSYLRGFTIRHAQGSRPLGRVNRRLGPMPTKRWSCRTHVRTSFRLARRALPLAGRLPWLAFLDHALLVWPSWVIFAGLCKPTNLAVRDAIAKPYGHLKGEPLVPNDRIGVALPVAICYSASFSEETGILGSRSAWKSADIVFGAGPENGASPRRRFLFRLRLRNDRPI